MVNNQWPPNKQRQATKQLLSNWPTIKQPPPGYRHVATHNHFWDTFDSLWWEWPLRCCYPMLVPSPRVGIDVTFSSQGHSSNVGIIRMGMIFSGTGLTYTYSAERWISLEIIGLLAVSPVTIAYCRLLTTTNETGSPSDDSWWFINMDLSLMDINQH